MPRIIPIRDLKNTSEISKMCHNSKDPVFITKNGYGDMVIMSINAYEEKMFIHDIYEKVDAAEDQIKEGKTLDAADSLCSLRKKYNV